MMLLSDFSTAIFLLHHCGAAVCVSIRHVVRIVTVVQTKAGIGTGEIIAVARAVTR